VSAALTYVVATLLCVAVMALGAALTLAAFWLWARLRNWWFGPRMTVTVDFAQKVKPGDRIIVDSGVILVRRVEGPCIFYERVQSPVAD
jgi:hypothetical protein